MAVRALRRAIAIDLGGTQIRAAVVDETGQLHNRVSRPTPARDGAAAVVSEMHAAVLEAIGGLAISDFVGVAVASPGPIDTETGVTLGLPTLVGFENVPLRQMLSDALGCQVHVENDGIASAIGEWKFGAGQGCRDFVYVTVSTGIGGGVISGGQVMRGRRGMAGHVGHLTLYPGGAKCNCGSIGCWEAYAAGPAFEARAKAKSGGHFSADAAAVFAAARDGDKTAIALVDEEASLLGLGVISLLHLYSPERVVFGGGLCHHFDLLKPGIVARINELAMVPFRNVEIMLAQHFGNSGLLGAAGLVL